MKKEKSPVNENNDFHEVIIQALIDAKNKETKAEKNMIRSGLFFLSLLLAGIIYIAILLQTTGQPSSYLSLIMSNNYILFWIAALFVVFFYFDSKTKSFEKAEKDYEELIEDIIDRSADIWDSEQLQAKKANQFRELKEKYDINLYHK